MNGRKHSGGILMADDVRTIKDAIRVNCERLIAEVSSLRGYSSADLGLTLALIDMIRDEARRLPPQEASSIQTWIDQFGNLKCTIVQLLSMGPAAQASLQTQISLSVAPWCRSIIAKVR